MKRREILKLFLLASVFPSMVFKNKSTEDKFKNIQESIKRDADAVQKQMYKISTSQNHMILYAPYVMDEDYDYQ